MRLVNFRYICSLRRLKFVIMILILLFIIFLHLNVISVKPRVPKIRELKQPWRFLKGTLFTSLKTNATCSTKLLFVILVSSNVGNYDRRNLIRKTWGSDYSLNPRWRTLFLLSTNENKEQMKRLSVEEGIYGDIVRSDYKEAFFNMAFKVAMGFEWAIKYCDFDYLLKADDDTFVNTHGLLNYFKRQDTPRINLYTGNPMIGSPVLRKGRYKVEYDRGEGRDDRLNKTFFAPYCSGGGFILSRDVVKVVLDRFDFDHPLNIDDAYIGELAERAKIKLLSDTRHFLMYENKCEYSPSAFVQHPAKEKCLEKLYEQHTKYLATGVLPTKPPTQPLKISTKPSIELSKILSIKPENTAAKLLTTRSRNIPKYPTNVPTKSKTVAIRTNLLNFSTQHA